MTDTRTIGARVRPSRYALESKRLYILSAGTHAEKVKRQGWYDAAANKRGMITAVQDRHGMMPGLSVSWDDGTRSECLVDQVEAIV